MKTYEGGTGLSNEDRMLVDVAIDSTKLAYAPYSNFRVGAALKTSGGAIVKGANQENASYPLCVCGERIALYNASIVHPGEDISVIAIYVDGNARADQPVPPCGACLQVISEYEMRQSGPIRLLLPTASGDVFEFESSRELLKMPFDGSFLPGQ